MVYKLNKWFIFEPCDQVLSLVTGAQGYIIESKSLDMQSQTQSVDILFRSGMIENVDAQQIELVRRTPIKHKTPCVND